MKKFRFDRNSKVVKCLSMLLLVVTICTTFLAYSEPIEVSADMDSNELITQQLEMWAADGLESLTSADDISIADLRYLALFLSNYYIPFQTVLDNDDEDLAIQDKEDLTEVLVDIGYSEDIAEALIDLIYAASLDSAELLYVKESDIDSTKTSGIGIGYSRASYNTSATAIVTRTNEIYIDSDTLNNNEYVAYAQQDMAEDGYATATLFMYMAGIDTISDNETCYAMGELLEGTSLDVYNDGDVDTNEPLYTEDSDLYYDIKSFVYALSNSDYVLSGSTIPSDTILQSFTIVDWFCFLGPITGIQSDGSYGPVSSSSISSWNTKYGSYSSSYNWEDYWDIDGAITVINGFGSLYNYIHSSTDVSSISATYKTAMNNAIDYIENYSAGTVDTYTVKTSDYDVTKDALDFYYNGEVVFTLDANTVAYLADMMTTASGADLGWYGNALVNTTDEDYSSASLSIYNIFFQNLYIDWVGNVICDLGDCRVVVYPACINTKTFTTISDPDTEVANMVSTYGFRVMSTYGAEAKVIDTFDSVSSSEYNFDVPEYYNYNLVANRGSTQEWVFNDSAFWPWNRDATSLTDALKLYDIRNPSGAFGGFDALSSTSTTSEFYAYFGSGSTISYTPRFYLDGGAYEITEDNSLNEIIFYTAVNSTNIDELNVGGLEVASMLDLTGSYFTTTAKFNSTSNSALFSYNSTDAGVLSSIALTYLYAFSNYSATEYDKETNMVDMRFNESIFPEVDGTFNMVEILANTGESNFEEMAFEVMNMVYYLLHPTEGVSYVATLVKNKTMGIMEQWHTDIVGASDSNSTTGMTYYLGTSGYTTTPNLDDVEWISVLVDSYDSIVVYLIMLVFIIIFCSIVVGSMTFQRGIVGILVFSVLAFFPPYAINMVVDAANQISDTIYNSKFDYWAVTQMETYLDELNDVTNATSTGEYMSELFELYAQNESSAASYSGAKLKWQTPKKFDDDSEAISDALSDINTESDIESDDATDAQLQAAEDNMALSDSLVAQITTNVTNSMSSEEYVGGTTYLYRDILDIYRYASISYNLYEEFDFGAANGTSGDGFYIGTTSGTNNIGSEWSSNADTLGVISYSSGEGLANYVMSNIENSNTYKTSLPDYIIDTNSLTAIERGFLVDTMGYNDSTSATNYYTNTDNLAVGLLLNFSSALIELQEDLTSLKSDISNKAVDVDVDAVVDNTYNYGVEDTAFSTTLVEFVSNGYSSLSELDTDVDDLYSEYGYFYYALYSESPFYYFSYNIQDQMTVDDLSYTYNYNNLTSSTGNFVNLILTENQDYFYNEAELAGDGAGELRDFTNMHDLFYYVIPALKVGNDTVEVFDDYFGMEMPSNSLVTFGSDSGFYYGGNYYTSLESFESVLDEMSSGDLYDFWKAYNIHTLYNSYTSWIDIMYDCSYAEPQTITIAGEQFTVTDPIDPTSYYSVDSSGNMISGRYMVFSESEMAYYGLTEKDLTTVEKKIINIQRGVYEETIGLLDYYTLSDETLINAYAMIILFEFNSEFSEIGIFNSYIMYPQSYELKAFSYDAYLRMILSGATGELLQTDEGESIYTRVMDKTSWFFGIFLIINDLIAVYIIPGLRLFFLVAIFLLSIVMITGSAVKLEFNFFKTLWGSLIKPLMLYFLVTVALSWIVSLFMYDNTSGVTGDTTYISLGDPTMTMIVMVIINAVVVVCYFKICVTLYNEIKKLSMALFATVGGVLGGALTAGMSAVSKGKQAVSNVGKGVGSAYNTALQRKQAGVDAISRAKAGAATAKSLHSKAKKELNKYDKKIKDGKAATDSNSAKAEGAGSGGSSDAAQGNSKTNNSSPLANLDSKLIDNMKANKAKADAEKKASEKKASEKPTDAKADYSSANKKDRAGLRMNRAQRRAAERGKQPQLRQGKKNSLQGFNKPSNTKKAETVAKMKQTESGRKMLANAPKPKEKNNMNAAGRKAMKEQQAKAWSDKAKAGNGPKVANNTANAAKKVTSEAKPKLTGYAKKQARNSTGKGTGSKKKKQ